MKFSVTGSSKILGKKELNTYAANKTTDNYSDSENHPEHHLG